MTQPDGSIRHLPSRFRRSEDLESDTPNTPTIDVEPFEWSTTDSDERVSIVMELSLNEYIALATSIDVGRDIAYGDNSLYIWWIWVRSLVSTDLCQSILECINDTEAIQEAIGEYGDISSIDGDGEQIAENLSSQLVNDPAGCDNDIIFGMTRQLVEFADRLIKDLFEQVKAANLSSENIGYLIKLIPVLETLPIDEMFEFGSKVANDMETVYLSASTELLKDEIACDLFCIAQDNDCVLTLADVRDYFEEKSGVVFTYDDVLSFMLDFISGVFIGNAVYYGMNVLFFQIFAFGGKFLEYFFRDYLRVVNSMYNDPDEDWTTVCDECPTTFEHFFDFTTGQHGWELRDAGSGDIGNYSAGNGFVYKDMQPFGTDYRRVCAIRRQFTDTEITSMTVHYDFTVGTWESVATAQNLQYINNGNLQTQIAIANDDMDDGSDLERTLTHTLTIDELRTFLASSADLDEAVYSGDLLISGITVTGDGDNPFD